MGSWAERRGRRLVRLRDARNWVQVGGEGALYKARDIPQESPMDLKRVPPPEAKRMVEEEGYRILDVRSREEFAEGHPEGAYNIPLLHKTPQGMVPNPEFAQVVQRTFSDPDTPVLVTCQMGGRSVRAALQMKSLGFLNVVDVKGGFGGERDDAGNVLNPGWRELSLPVATEAQPGRDYAALEAALHDAPAEPEPSSPDAAAAEGTAFNRFASRHHRVFCQRLQEERAGLKRRPFPGALGQRIYDSISADAWNEWVEHSKMLINEYHIRSTDPAAMQLLLQQCEQFFFGDGLSRPEGYVPEGAAPAEDPS